MRRAPPTSPLFPYTTLFRSQTGAPQLYAHVQEYAAPKSVDEGRAEQRFAELMAALPEVLEIDRKSTRLNSSHVAISYAVFCLKKKNEKKRLCESGNSVRRMS